MLTVGGWGLVGRHFALLALLALCAVTARADVASFDDANRLYEQGKYREATEAYSNLIASGTSSPALWFNLANAQFKSGQIGHAIASYRQSARMEPRDPDVRANLEFARRQVAGPTLRHGWLQSRMASLTTNEWTILALVPVWMCLLLLVIAQFKPGWKMSLRRWTWASGIAGAAASVLLAVAFQQQLKHRAVVVSSRDVAVRAGPFDESPTAFTASDGAEFALLDAKGDWFQVSDGTRPLGWLKTNSVTRLP